VPARPDRRVGAPRPTLSHDDPRQDVVDLAESIAVDGDLLA
jgi:hypothetical protein